MNETRQLSSVYQWQKSLEVTSN